MACKTDVRLELCNFAGGGLQPVSLTFAAGECVTISGASGSGKSRFLRAIADLDQSTGGCLLDGRERASIEPAQWRRNVGLVPADGGWWDEHVAAHFYADTAASTREQLSRLGLPHEALDWPVSRLSSGERQRLVLLRALSAKPKVLLLDEPTANLDEQAAARVAALMADVRVQQQVTLLWVSHDPVERRQVAERNLLVSDGLIQWEPSPL